MDEQGARGRRTGGAAGGALGQLDASDAPTAELSAVPAAATAPVATVPAPAGPERAAGGPAGRRPRTDGTDGTASRRRRRGLLGLVLLVAAALRIPGITWGLPVLLYADEPLVVKDAVGLVARNSFQPTIFDRPDHLEVKLDSLLFRAWTALTPGGDAPARYLSDPAQLYAVARSLTVLFALATVVLAHLIGTRFGRWAGPVAAALVAVFPPFVANSSLVTPDVPLTCLLCAVVWAGLRYLERPTVPRLLLACAFTALAVTAKYPGALGGAVVAAAVVLAHRRNRDRKRFAGHLLLAPAGFLAALFVASPELLTRFDEVQRQLVGQSGSGHLGASGLGFTGNSWFYLQYLGGWLGVVLVAAAIAGAYRLVTERDRRGVLLLIGVVYWPAISALGLHWQRWSLPMAITPVLLAAIGIDGVLQRVRGPRTAAAPASAGRRWVPRVAVVGTAAALGLALLTQLAGAAAQAASFAVPDTRVAARPALERLGITPDDTVSDGYTPFFPTSARLATTRLEFDADGRLLGALTPGARFVMISSAMYDRVADDPQWAATARQYAAVERLPLVAEFRPTVQPPNGLGAEPLTLLGAVDQLRAALAGGAESGPTIRVYRLQPAEETGDGGTG